MRLALWLVPALLLLAKAPAAAPIQGFQLNRYEPTVSGSWFFAVEHPYYSSQRSLAAGLHLTYAHAPLRYAERDINLSVRENVHAIIGHQIVSHFDVALAVRDRMLIHLSIPLVLFESGEPTFGITPLRTVAISDPRVTVTTRLYGHPHKNPWSAHISVSFWYPLRALASDLPQQSSDAGARLRVGAIFSGLLRGLLWSTSLAFVYRSNAQLGTGLEANGASVGPEAQVGLAAGYLLPKLRLVFGPEFLLSTSLLPSQAFRSTYTSLEILLGTQFNIAKAWQIGLAAGLGFLSAPGTPDGRLLLRFAYAPVTRDRDQDGIPDDRDACPDQKGVRSDVPSNNGCPLIPDRDCDGIPDSEDECPDVAEGKRPDPKRIGCPFGNVAFPPAAQNGARPTDETEEPPPHGVRSPR